MKNRGKGTKKKGGKAATNPTATPRIISPGDIKAANRKTAATRAAAIHLPGQYTFTPNTQPPESQPTPPLVFPSPSPPGVRDYPPPVTLFNQTISNPGAATSSGSRRSPQAQPRTSAPLINHPATSPHRPVSPSCAPRTSLNSSQAQNSVDEDESSDEEYDIDNAREPTLSPNVLAALHALLMENGREDITTVLSKRNVPGTLW